MASLNKIFVIGAILSDPDSRFSVDGTPITKFWIEINGGFNQKAGKIEVVCWQKLAETSSGALKRGLTILVEGYIRNRSFEDQSGTRKWVTEISAARLQPVASSTAAPMAEAKMGAGEFLPEAEAGFSAVEALPEDDMPF